MVPEREPWEVGTAPVSSPYEEIERLKSLLQELLEQECADGRDQVWAKIINAIELRQRSAA